MKYVFLDIDGVLNSDRTVMAYKRILHCGHIKAAMVAGREFNPMWDSIAVNMLRTAQETIGFKVVISSTWRKVMSLRDFHTLFDFFEWDTREVIVGTTDSGSGCRGDQIQRWLEANTDMPLGRDGSPKYKYCIIDDDSDMLPIQQASFVKVDAGDGLSFHNFRQIYDIFDHANYFNVSTTPTI